MNGRRALQPAFRRQPASVSSYQPPRPTDAWPLCTSVLPDLYIRLNPNRGRAVMIMERKILGMNNRLGRPWREEVARSGQLDAVIALPLKIFKKVAIGFAIVILRPAPIHDNVLCIYAEGPPSNTAKVDDVFNADLGASIVDAYKNRTAIDGFAQPVLWDDLKNMGYELRPSVLVPSGKNPNRIIAGLLEQRRDVERELRLESDAIRKTIERLGEE
ncbi:SAM-dependent DNA methyltransferase [Oceanidesulfovibrio marinus]|uniref:SAM-dependent DNA methyltransferase n=2 Tax=Oceanidesulfovibrio marinus TaxID=370038 RepID=A0ABX6NBP2_9BACT|nr:SAM-dependent DNA methyltransferase [Oceanidesulfovibrio marinus]